MPSGRTPQKLESVRAEITQLYTTGTSIPEILSILELKHNLRTSRHTLYRRMKIWGISVNRTVTKDTPELRDWIRSHFFDLKPTDRELVQLLEGEGFVVSVTGIQRLRKDIDLWHRFSDAKLDERKDVLRQYFEQNSGYQLSALDTISKDESGEYSGPKPNPGYLLPRLSRRGLYRRLYSHAEINIPMHEASREFKAHFPKKVDKKS